MPLIPTENPIILDSTGVHLWHAEMSSCSQRVRIAMAEKDLAFESHVINLHLAENASDEYQAIHPNGVVPAMAIDGELFIESVDIIDEIDRRFAGPSLRPTDPNDHKLMEQIMARADQAQSALKLLTFEFLFSVAPPAPVEAMEKIQANHRSEYLKQFYLDLAAGFPRERVAKAVMDTHADFSFLDECLNDGRPYFLGEQFTLADIAWAPNLHRFELISWPIDKYSKLESWLERIKQRPSYQRGLVEWEPKQFVEMVGPKIEARRAAGDGVENYLTA